jgi:hypothetical protein
MSRHLIRHASIAILCGLVFAGVADARPFASHRTLGTAPIVWQAAPKAGAEIVVDASQRIAFVIKAAAADPNQTVELSILGATPARITSTPGNPATGSISIASHKVRGERFALTFVARTSAPHAIAITRTVVVVVRPGVVPLAGGRLSASHWAYILEETSVRSAPSTTGRVISTLSTATSDGHPNLVLALAEKWNVHSGLWIRVLLTALPNGLTGWVQRSALSNLQATWTQIVVDTRTFSLTLLKRGKPIFRAPVGIGLRASPTPTGHFYIREKLTNFHDPFYGPIAFGTNARSEVLTDWPGGGIVGIHGTNAPGLIPGRVSHGCIRMRNSDILRLARLLSLGTPLVVR